MLISKDLVLNFSQGISDFFVYTFEPELDFLLFFGVILLFRLFLFEDIQKVIKKGPGRFAGRLPEISLVSDTTGLVFRSFLICHALIIPMIYLMSIRGSGYVVIETLLTWALALGLS